MRLFCLILAWMFLPLSVHAAAPAKPVLVTSVEGITEYRLANGLQLLLAPDDSKPTTTVNLTVHVGSRHENYGETGMAHLLEHLVFKGSPATRNPWAEFTRRGLRANGSTWLDRTNYFASFAANDDNLKWYIGWQADALVNSFIAKRDLDTEMTVVRNEMEMGENDPGRILFEKTLATMYQWHNYGKSTIGARTDVENVDITRLQGFYRRYYQPDNATLIVTGKFEPAQVLAWVQQAFGKLPRSKAARPTLYTLDAVQDGERAVTVRRVGGTALAMAGYHMPPGPHPDFAAAELLTLILGDAPAGRLHRKLVEGGRAASSFGDAMALAEPGVVLLGLDFAPGQVPDAALPDMLATIEGLAADPVTDEEFRRAQGKWLKQWETQFTDPERVGVALTESVGQGDWRMYFLQRDRVRNTTLADVRRVAAERFVPSNRTLGLYVPTDKPVRAPSPAAVDLVAQLKGFQPQAGAAKVAAFDASPANIDRQTRTTSLPSGLKLALLPKPTRGGAVALQLTLHLGDLQSLQGQRNAASMVAGLLDKGSEGLSRQQIQDRLDALKTELAIGGSAGTVSVSMTTRREHVNDALALLGRLLRTPQFPEAAFEERRRQVLAQIQSSRDDPEALAELLLERRANPYPPQDPRYVPTFEEAEANLRAVTLQQVKDFHRRFYGASAGELSVVGDFDPASLEQAARQALGDWRSPTAYARVPVPLVDPQPGREQLRTPDKQNAMLAVRQALPLNDSHADYPALMLANFLLGSGGDSRLWKRIREKEGLSYGVWSSIDWGRHELHSVWHAGAIFAPANRDKVERALAEEVERALKDGFTPAEVDAGKKALVSMRRLSRAQDRALAGGLGGNLELGRTYAVAQRVDDALAAATADQVNAALRKYIRPSAFATAVAGDFKP